MKQNKMKIIGLTGGIATGKSTVTQMLLDHGWPVIDADKISRETLNVNEEAIKAVRLSFGDHLFIDGTLDRKKLGAIVFSDANKLRVLESIIHPIVRKEILEAIEGYKLKGIDHLVIDAPLLIEGGLDSLCDEVWLVYVDRSTQVQRVVARDGVTEEYAMNIIKQQMSLDDKRKRAQVLIDNNGTKETLVKLIISLVKNEQKYDYDKNKI